MTTGYFVNNNGDSPERAEEELKAVSDASYDLRETLRKLSVIHSRNYLVKDSNDEKLIEDLASRANFMKQASDIQNWADAIRLEILKQTQG